MRDALGGHGGIEDEVDAGVEFGVGREVDERFGEAVHGGELVFAERADVVDGAVAGRLIRAGATAEGEAADFPHCVAPDEAEENALCLDGGAAGEAGLDVCVERDFGETDGRFESARVHDDEAEGVGVAVSEFAELFGEDEEAFARRERAGGDLDFVEEQLGEAGEKIVLVCEVRIERHGLDAEFG